MKVAGYRTDMFDVYMIESYNNRTNENLSFQQWFQKLLDFQNGVIEKFYTDEDVNYALKKIAVRISKDSHPLSYATYLNAVKRWE